jgi:hypothetical protein
MDRSILSKSQVPKPKLKNGQALNLTIQLNQPKLNFLN